jgi:uncharacterized membrane protein YdjX (TVP38/TMEM64 family)
MKNRHFRLAAVALFLLLLWAAFTASGLREHFTVQFLHDSFEHHKLGGLALFITLFALGNLVQIPGWVFLVAAVLALGQVWGGLATYLAACVSCLLTFWFVRLIGGDALRHVGGRLGAGLFARLDAHPVQTVALLRVLFQTLPALNYVLALSGIRTRSHALGTVLGLPLPIALYCVFIHTLARWLHWPVG